MKVAGLQIGPARKGAAAPWALTLKGPQSLLKHNTPSGRNRGMQNGEPPKEQRDQTGDPGHLGATVSVLPRRTWTCLVDEDGRLAEYEDRAGLTTVQSLPDLVVFARAFLRAGRDWIAFHWVPPHSETWFLVNLRSDPTAFGRARAILNLQLYPPPFDLTVRELDILTLVAAGLANETVAARLEISVRTVAKHVENIFRKTGVWSRAGLAGLAADQGLMRLPVPGGCDGFPLAIGQIDRLVSQLDSPQLRSRPMQMRPILIGIPHADEGRGRADASEMLNGADLAAAEINARGGILGRQVELVRAPYAPRDPASIIAAYHHLVEAEVDAVSAGYACYHPQAQDLVGNYGAPLLHAATMRCAVDRVRDSRARLGNVFQTCASDVNYGLGLSRFLSQLQVRAGWQPQSRRLAVVQPPWPGLDIGLDAVDRALDRQGWQIDLITADLDTAAGWGQVIRRLHELRPAVVVLASYFVEDAIAFQRAFVGNPLPALVYCIYSPSVPQFAEELGDKAEGVIWATTTGLYSDAIGNAFRRRYQQRFGRLPGLSQAGIAYDKVKMLAGAWSRSGSVRRFGDVVEDLRSSICRGVNGAYYLGTEGQVGLAFPDDTADPSISQAHLIFQVQDGQNVIIDPMPYAYSSLRLPPWMVR